MPAEVRTTSSTGGQKGVKLQQFDLIPTRALGALAEHYGRGARKYARHQWRQGYEWSKSYSAAMRHMNAFWAGEDYDTCVGNEDECSFETVDGEKFEPLEENTCYNHTGSPHVVAAMWHMSVLLDFMSEHPQFDDRFQYPERGNT